jgi:perosamine synthetase
VHQGLTTERIPVAGPSITQKEIDYVADAARSAWYEDAGRYHRRFEEAFAERLGVRFAVALPSCTSAIHLSLAALGIGPGDEVIVPDLTWIASAAPVTYLGATPIFADIEPRTLCVSAEAVEARLTSRTRAIIAVDLYGNMPDMDRLRAISDRRGVAVIEDAAQAIGATYRGTPAGALGTTGVFSFHGSKTMTTGEGGMLVTSREDLHKRVLSLRDHGRPPGDKRFINTEIAYKYRMSAVQAALGLAQLERLDELVAGKRRIFAWYARELGGAPGLLLDEAGEGVEHARWMVNAFLDPSLGLDKDELLELLDARGIDARPVFRPLSSLPAYAGHADAAKARRMNRESYRISPYGVSLPSALCLTEASVARVCESLKAIVRERGRAPR